MSRFINNRKNNWQRLEDLLILADAASLRGLSLSPSTNLPPLIKFATGISTGIAMYSYLFLVGRDEEARQK